MKTNRKIRTLIEDAKIQSHFIPIDVALTEQVVNPHSKKERLNNNKLRIIETIKIPIFGYETNQIEVFYKPISRVMNPELIIKL